jgi:hypothetical protein
MYLLPKTVVKKIDGTRKRFFWLGGGTKKKYHLVKWCVVARPKLKGGLGVKDLRKMNLSLPCKWWWKLENGEGLWQEIVKKKYKIKGGIATLRYNPKNSPVWNDMIRIKDYYLAGRQIIIGNGLDTDFWRDPWCGPVALKEKFSSMFDICNEQTGSVAEMVVNGWRLSFRRWLDEHDQVQFRHLRDILSSCAMGNDKDRPLWIWGKKKSFSVKTMYAHLCRNEIEKHNKRIWKAKMPLKVKIFMWLMQLNAILTRDNLSKRKWQGDKRCGFCNNDESVMHLFFECALARYIWSLIAMLIGADYRPINLDQYWY